MVNRRFCFFYTAILRYMCLEHASLCLRKRTALFCKDPPAPVPGWVSLGHVLNVLNFVLNVPRPRSGS